MVNAPQFTHNKNLFFFTHENDRSGLIQDRGQGNYKNNVTRVQNLHSNLQIAELFSLAFTLLFHCVYPPWF